MYFRTLVRDRAPFQSTSCPPRNDWHIRSVRSLHHGLHLLGRRREHHNIGWVSFVEAHVTRVLTDHAVSVNPVTGDINLIATRASVLDCLDEGWGDYAIRPAADSRPGYPGCRVKPSPSPGQDRSED